MLASILVTTGMAIVGVLGTLHLFYTIQGTKLLPRESGVKEAMETSGLAITRQTTVWRAWIGFNATHSMGILLFALIYAWFAIVAPGLLFGSWFLRLLGLAMLVGYAVLSKLYFFRIPYRGVVVATALYVAGIVAAVV